MSQVTKPPFSLQTAVQDADPATVQNAVKNTVKDAVQGGVGIVNPVLWGQMAETLCDYSGAVTEVWMSHHRAFACYGLLTGFTTSADADSARTNCWHNVDWCNAYGKNRQPKSRKETVKSAAVIVQLYRTMRR